MSLYLFRDWMNEMERPSRLLDQRFGLGLSPADMLMPLTVPTRHNFLNYYRPWRTDSTDAGSTLQVDKDTFRVELDVQHFNSEEVTVKVSDGFVTVEGTHEEKQDEHGYVSRKFVRRYMVPDGFDLKAIASSLSSDGVLTVTAPKLAQVESNERTIPITHTGGPHRPITQQEEKTEEEK